jgi:hypothetical protein
MPTDSSLSHNLLTSLYSTFDHNKVVIGFFMSALVSAFLVFKKPSRFHLLLLFGFAILTFEYEYDKHILAPLRDQTLQSVTPDPNLNIRTQRYIDGVLRALIPMILFILGWGMVLWAMLIGGKKSGQKDTTV